MNWLNLSWLTLLSSIRSWIRLTSARKRRSKLTILCFSKLATRSKMKCSVSVPTACAKPSSVARIILSLPSDSLKIAALPPRVAAWGGSQAAITPSLSRMLLSHSLRVRSLMSLSLLLVSISSRVESTARLAEKSESLISLS